MSLPMDSIRHEDRTFPGKAVPILVSRFRFSHPYLGLEWHGQVQPGRLQSPCLVSYVAFSLQKDEIIGGKMPRGYPGKELSVGSGDVSG